MFYIEAINFGMNSHSLCISIFFTENIPSKNGSFWISLLGKKLRDLNIILYKITIIVRLDI